MVKPFISLTIRPRNFTALFRLLTSDYKKHGRKSADEVAAFAQKTMKALVPVRTGRLRNSIMIFSKTTRGGATDLRSTIRVGSRLSYAGFVDKGTKSSSGRFVPALGRRIHTGTHPGVRPRNFVEKTKVKTDKFVNKSIRKVFKKWARSWRSKF